MNCISCNSRWNDVVSYRLHVVATGHVASDRGKLLKPWGCVNCTENFNTLEQFQNHCDALHKDDDFETYRCSKCDTNMGEKKKMAQHIWICQEYEEKMMIQEQTSKRKRNGIDDEVPGASGCATVATVQSKRIKPLGCTNCDETFDFLKDFEDHHNAIHATLRDLFKCSECKAVLDEEDDITGHIRQCQQEIKTITSKDIQINCKFCNVALGFVPNTRSSLLISMMCIDCKAAEDKGTILAGQLDEKEDFTLKCPFVPCTETCESVPSFQNHITSNHENYQDKLFEYRCEQDGCREQFKDPSSVIEHYEIRHQQTVYPCSRCPKIFQTATSYDNHMNRLIHLPGFQQKDEDNYFGLSGIESENFKNLVFNRTALCNLSSSRRRIVYVVVGVKKTISSVEGFDILKYLDENRNNRINIYIYIGKVTSDSVKFKISSYHTNEFRNNSSIGKNMDGFDFFAVHYFDCENELDQETMESALQHLASWQYDIALNSNEQIPIFEPLWTQQSTGPFLNNMPLKLKEEVLQLALLKNRTFFCLGFGLS